MTVIRRIGAAALPGFVIAATLWTGGVGAQQAGTPCNPRLTPQQGEFGYRVRDKDRCEGVYERLVALGSLRPVSLIHGEQPVPPDFYRVSWPDAGGPNPVLIQALSFKDGVLYRMDAIGRDGSFTWNTAVLTGVGLRQGDFGVVATTTADVGGQSGQRIYLPVTLTAPALSTTRKPAPGAYILKMASVEDLADVFLTVRGPLVPNETPQTIISDKSVARSYYSAAAPLQIALDLPSRPGIYEVRVAGLRRARPGSTTSSFFVRHGQ